MIYCLSCLLPWGVAPSVAIFVTSRIVSFAVFSVPVPVPVFVLSSPFPARGPVELFRCLKCSFWMFQSPG